MAVVERARLRDYTTAGSLGVVTDTHYVRCFWPTLDRPTRLFAAGSGGLIIEGPPSPRNVVFPAGTTFIRAAESYCLRDVRDEAFEVSEEVDRDIEVEPGLTRKVRYEKLVSRVRRLRRTVPLTRAQALDLLRGDKTAAQLRAELADLMVREPD